MLKIKKKKGISKESRSYCFSPMGGIKMRKQDGSERFFIILFVHCFFQPSLAVSLSSLSPEELHNRIKLGSLYTPRMATTKKTTCL